MNAYGSYDAEFGQVRAECGRQHRTLAYDQFAHQDERVLLVCGLDRHEAYGQSGDGLGNRLRVSGICFVSLHIS